MYAISRKDGMGEKLTVTDDALLEACARLSNHGVHPLNVAPVAPPAIMAPAANDVQVGPAAPATIPAPAPVNSTWEHQVSDDAAGTRIQAQHGALRAAGFAVDTSQQAYATGTRMADVGYRTQEGRKAEHDALALVRDAGQALMARVRDERREDRTVTARDIADSLHVNGSIDCLDGFALTEHAIRGLAARIESPMTSYIMGVRDRMRERGDSEADRDANNADRREIARVIAHECRQASDEPFVLRTRAVGMHGTPDVYACVSTTYAPADAPEAVAELVDGLPRDARGSWTYDPTSTAWELRAEVWTPTPVAEQAVGEAFKGYASFQGRDNGTRRFSGGGGIELLRCLNASTYFADGASTSRTHRGRILHDVRAMVRGSLKAIDALCAAWGVNRARTIDLPRTDDGTDKPIPIEQAIPGFWSYMLRDRRSELVGVLPGRSAAHVEDLTRAYFDERRDPSRLVRSDFAQGWTRYIQDQPTDVRRVAEQAIGDWLVSGKPVRYDAQSV